IAVHTNIARHAKTGGPCNPFTSHASRGLFRVCEPCSANGCCGASRRGTSVGPCGFSRTNVTCGPCGICGPGLCRTCGPCAQFGCFASCESCGPHSAGKTCSPCGSRSCCGSCNSCGPFGPCGGSRCGVNGTCCSNLSCGSYNRRSTGGCCRPCESCGPCGPCDPWGPCKPCASATVRAPCKQCASPTPFNLFNSCNPCNPAAKFSSCDPSGPCIPCTPWAPCGSSAPPSCCSLPRRTCRVPNYTQEYLAAIRRCCSTTVKKVRVKKAKKPRIVISKSAASKTSLALC
ncbi:keratin-associated protein 5-1-like, partial [Bactrocera neohumeralis]|uniref:keratin-associated protein 5-1-like n=1 Tax=Bactrocera neohumeralis TaxID=98809 RepID=UPI0021656CF3